MALMLRANTAVDVLIGPFVDEDDGKTAETGLTITQADVRLSKNGQNIAQKNDANAAAHDELGYHNCPLDTTDTNTEGMLVLAVHECGALPVRHEYNVLAEAAWDSMFAAKDDGFMDVNIKTVGRTDTQETEANNLESACANYSVTRGLTGTALPAAVGGANGGVPLGDASSRVDVGSWLGTAVTLGNGAPDVNIASTDDIDLSATQKTSVNTEVDNSMITYNLDHLCLTATAAADMTTEVADNTILSRVLANGDTSAFTPSTDGLQPIRDRGDAAWVSATSITTVTGNVNGNVGGDVQGNVDGSTASVSGAVGSVTGACGSVTGAVGSVTGAVGSVTGAVGSVTAGVSVAVGGIASTAFGASAIDAAALATDAVTEIRDACNDDIIDTQGNYTVQQALSIILAAVAGVTGSSGALLKSPNGVSNRISATINASQERTAMTLTPGAGA